MPLKNTMLYVFFLSLPLMVGCKNSHDQRVHAELEQEFSQIVVPVQGAVPEWLEGLLVRNGPVTVSVDGKHNKHWFDGLAMLHAFTIKQGAVSYANRFLRTQAYDQVFNKKSLGYSGFAADPCRSIFKRFFSWFLPAKSHALNNANVNVAKIANRYVALTEIPLPVQFDPVTLETVGVLDYKDSLPHRDTWESAHPHCNPATGDALSFVMEYGRQSYYCLYTILANTLERKVFARIPVDKPSYMHSFAITDQYVVLVEFPFVVNPLSLLLTSKAFIKNFSWQPELGTCFTVVNHSTGEIVGKYRSKKAFFAFHHINAYESDEGICCDMVCYDDASVIYGASDDKLQEQSNESTIHQYVKRFVINQDKRTITEKTILCGDVEFPRINEKYDGKPYRYVYMTNPDKLRDAHEVRPLYKLDMETGATTTWSQPGCQPGEPIFVADPMGQKEDDGVILTIVIDIADHSSFLLILDAKTFTELARATVQHQIPVGLHGQFFSNK